ncbi:MAG: PAS domain S-box protein [Chloroflexota bacterium]
MKAALTNWRSTRFRLFALMLLVALPALGVQVFGAWSDLQRDLADRESAVIQVAAQAQGEFINLVAKSRTVFTDLVRLNEMRRPDNCTQIYNDLRFAYERLAPDATNLALADADGNLYCAVNPLQGERNIAIQLYFQSAVQTLDLAIGTYTRTPNTSAPTLAIAYPVLSFDGEPQTVIIATFDTHWLEAWQSAATLPPGAALTLLTSDGEILQRWVDGAMVEPTQVPAGWFDALPDESGVIEVLDVDGVRRLDTRGIIGSDPAPTYFHLGYPVAEIYVNAYRSLWWKLALLGLTFLGAMLVAWWGSERWFLYPLNQLMSAVNQVQAGDLSVRSAAPTERSHGLDELILLAQSFDRMADALQQREIERRQSEERFRAVYENAAIGISLVAPDRQVLDVNPTLLQMSGYTEAELKELRGLGITYPEDLEVGQAELGEVLAGKRPSYQVEKRYIHKDGRVHWIRQTVSPVRDPDGKLLYLVTIAEDIDQQKRAVEELRESEARFRAMFDSAAVGVAVMTLDRRIVQVNQTATRLTGYTPEEMNAINPSMLAIEEDRYIDRELFIELIQGQRDQYTVEKRYIRKDGSIFWGRVNFSAVRGADGKPVYTIGLIEDISEEKEAQNRIAESEALFRTLYDYAEIGIVLVDLGTDGNQPLDATRFRQLVTNQRFNPAMLRMFGYREEEFLRTEIIDLIYPDDRNLDTEQFRQLLIGEIDGFRSEKRFVRKNGSVFWGRLTDSLVRAADGTPRMVIGIIEDVNEERQVKERLIAQEAEYRHTLEERIAERTAELHQANALLQQKAAQDAVTAERTRLARDLHDAVTQTLFSTTLIADVLPDIWDMNPEEGKRRLEEVRQLTRGALAEMRTLLVELRPNALIEIPLPTLLRQLTEAMIGRSRINIQLGVEGDSMRKLPPEVQVGLYRLAQEALNNVVKHAKASQAIITLRLGEIVRDERVRDEQVRRGLVRLTVVDNGIGFDPSRVTVDHLGLQIMRERAEAIGAKFSIYSEPGEGTQISVVW